MMEFTLFDVSSGLVLCRYCGQNVEGNLSLYPNAASIEGSFSDEYFIDGGCPTLRPVMAIGIDKTVIQSDGIDSATITGSPPGAAFFATNGTDSVSGPIADPDWFATAVAGTYRVKVTCWPYLDWEGTIDAV